MDLTTKTVLNFKEACEYTGLKPSYMYKLTHTGQVKFYKPFGKVLFFRREELEELLTRKSDNEKVKNKG